MKWLPVALVCASLGVCSASAQEKPPKALKQCLSCHKLTSDAGRAVGPHLEGLNGAVIGARVEGYKYSKTLKEMGAAGGIWDEASLLAFLENPKAYARGTKMAFKGLRKAEDREAVVAFLLGPSAGQEDAMSAQNAAPEVELSDAILALEGDAEYGEYLASGCVSCHKLQGADEGIPSIIGWPTESFKIAFYAYKLKKRDHPVMQMMAAPLADDEIAALAEYFGNLE